MFPAGVADESGGPVTEDTLFAYRSVTKSLVTTVVLQLADEGVIDLDSPVPTAGTGVDGDASVSDLARMTSGIPNYSAQPGLGELLTAQWDRSWTDTTLYALIVGVPASFAAGSSYQYSNTNTLLLGQLITSHRQRSRVPVPRDEPRRHRDRGRDRRERDRAGFRSACAHPA